MALAVHCGRSVRNRNSDVTQPIGRINRQVREHGEYRAVAQLSRGGMGDVYLAEDRRSGERVAIKLLDRRHATDTHIVDRFFAERQVSHRVQHAGLLDVRECGFDAAGQPYIVMEYLDGENLGELADRGLVDLHAVIAIGRQIAAAVGALHEAGIVHCDLKPSNTFVLYETTKDGWPRVKVIDYGVAKLDDTPAPVEGMIAGTPHYMPPEQWNGEPVQKSDVYALGCMLFELLTGELPFIGTLPQLMISHSEALPPRPSWRRATLPDSLDRLVMRMLSKDPAMRPTMGEVELELGALLALLAPIELTIEAIAS